MEVRAAGFEPASMAWQATVLTRLYYARVAAPTGGPAVDDSSLPYK